MSYQSRYQNLVRTLPSELDQKREEQWFESMVKFVHSKRWDLLTRPPTPNHMAIGQIILKYIETPITSDIISLIERLEDMTPDKWYKYGARSAATNFSSLRYLIESGLVDPNRVSLYSLAESCFYYNWKEKLDYLLSVGMHVDIQNDYGDTPLICLLKRDSMFKEEIAYYLIAQGADPLLQNKMGRCALDYSNGVI